MFAMVHLECLLGPELPNGVFILTKTPFAGVFTTAD